MKNLANCKPSEFLKQTFKIKKFVENWLDLTGIMEIRKRMPDIPEDATDDDKKKLTNEQAVKNASAMLDVILGEYPDETLELLGLLCFVDKEDIDNHTIAEYLRAFKELITNEDVVDFFTSLVNLGLMPM